MKTGTGFPSKLLNFQLFPLFVWNKLPLIKEGANPGVSGSTKEEPCKSVIRMQEVGSR